MRTLKLTKDSQKNILESLLKRSPNNYTEYESTVNEIINNVKENRDKAVFEYTKKFDKADVDASNIRVTEEEIKEAYELVDEKLLAVIKKALVNIRKYHEKQLQNSWFTTEDGIILGQKVTPIAKAGVYVPGGKAVYPSSVLMNVLPAKVAGVEKIVMCTPCGADGKVYPSTLVAANEAGVDEIYKVGGAQAIAAMAFGTESVPKVDKIVGPGNIFVALAKKAVFGYVSIDSIAGPSEILVLADETANPRYVAADLLSQAEHDEVAQSILISSDARLLDQVDAAITEHLTTLPKAQIAQTSLQNRGALILVRDRAEALALINQIAPEHLELCMDRPEEMLDGIRHAGAIFMGRHSPEAIGDYCAGPNHVLPTSGTARFSSPLGVYDFQKRSSIIYCSPEGSQSLARAADILAQQEDLDAHARSARYRVNASNSTGVAE